mgnify:CR=1 FL=1
MSAPATAPDRARETVLEIQGVTKRFGPVVALRRVELILGTVGRRDLHEGPREPGGRLHLHRGERAGGALDGVRPLSLVPGGEEVAAARVDGPAGCARDPCEAGVRIELTVEHLLDDDGVALGGDLGLCGRLGAATAGEEREDGDERESRHVRP